MKIRLLLATGAIWEGEHHDWHGAPRSLVLRLTVFDSQGRGIEFVGYDRYYVAEQGGWVRVGGIKDDPADRYFDKVSEWRFRGHDQVRPEYFSRNLLDVPQSAIAAGVFVADEIAREYGIA